MTQSSVTGIQTSDVVVGAVLRVCHVEPLAVEQGFAALLDVERPATAEVRVVVGAHGLAGTHDAVGPGNVRSFTPGSMRSILNTI